jgi:uncharacterized protein (TIGR03083 family)
VAAGASPAPSARSAALAGEARAEPAGAAPVTPSMARRTRGGAAPAAAQVMTGHYGRRDRRISVGKPLPRGQDGRVESEEHIAALEKDGTLLAAAADRAGLGAPVPSCPDWQVRDLLRHIGHVHRWAASYVGDARTEMAEDLAEEEVLRAGPGDADLLGWFRDGHAELVRVLRSADHGLNCWTFLGAPSPLAFWARRQAHETAIHRADAESAAGEVTGFPAPFAADGIDELIMGFWARGRAGADRQCALHVLATDTGDGWLADLGARTAERRPAAAARRPAAAADCVVAGPAAQVYLLLWNRPPHAGQCADTTTVTGDPATLRLWQDLMKVRWS